MSDPGQDHSDKRADRGDVRAGKAEDRLDALETESHDDVYAETREGHGGHEDRIGQLEHDDTARLRAVVSLRALWHDLVPAVAIGLALWAVTIAQGQVDDVADAQSAVKAQVASAQLEVLRTCIRSNINGAIIALSVRRPQPGRPSRERELNQRISENLFPVLDCKQSQLQGKSIELAPVERDKYITLVARGRAPVVSMGKVVGSRPSVLERVRNPDDVGKPPK